MPRDTPPTHSERRLDRLRCMLGRHDYRLPTGSTFRERFGVDSSGARVWSSQTLVGICRCGATRWREETT